MIALYILITIWLIIISRDISWVNQLNLNLLPSLPLLQLLIPPVIKEYKILIILNVKQWDAFLSNPREFALVGKRIRRKWLKDWLGLSLNYWVPSIFTLTDIIIYISILLNFLIPPIFFLILVYFTSNTSVFLIKKILWEIHWNC